jgi:AcrR family transcriptional regulator
MYTYNYSDGDFENLQAYKACYDHSSLAFCVIDLLYDNAKNISDFKFIYVNSALAKLENKTIEELLNHSFYSVFKNSEKKWLDYYVRVAIDGVPGNFTEFSPEIGKSLNIQAYQISFGRCGCLLSVVPEPSEDKISNQNKWNKKDQENQFCLYTAFRKYTEKKELQDLSIRKLCELAGISTGSFYNLYKSFDDFKTQFFFNDFNTYYRKKWEDENGFPKLNAIEKLMNIYAIYADYCVYKGKHFIGFFFSPQAPIHIGVNEDGTPDRDHLLIFNDIYECITEAQEKNMLTKEMNQNFMVIELHLVIAGLIYNWCTFDRDIDLAGLVKDTFDIYFSKGLIGAAYEALAKRIV